MWVVLPVRTTEPSSNPCLLPALPLLLALTMVATEPLIAESVGLNVASARAQLLAMAHHATNGKAARERAIVLVARWLLPVLKWANPCCWRCA